jgi:hypothetical protein
VRRLLVFVLAQALVVSPAMVSSLHVHEYAGHDHPDHHHGPAAHEHAQLALEHHDHEGAASAERAGSGLESCDPGGHVIAVKPGCVEGRQAYVGFAEQPGPTIAAPSVPFRSALPVTDVRVHGPPSHTRIPSRAPPVIPHA